MRTMRRSRYEAVGSLGARAEKLVMVSTSKRTKAPNPDDYVYVDWRGELAAQHNLAFPGRSSAGVVAGSRPARERVPSRAAGRDTFVWRPFALT
jgi:hypothetical protein